MHCGDWIVICSIKFPYSLMVSTGSDELKTACPATKHRHRFKQGTGHLLYRSLRQLNQVFISFLINDPSQILNLIVTSCMNVCPPNPWITVIIRIISTNGSVFTSNETGCEGLLPPRLSFQPLYFGDCALEMVYMLHMNCKYVGRGS